MARLMGFECKLYRGAVGSTASIEADTVKDVKPIYTPDEVEASNRKSKFKKYLQGMVDSGAEWDMDFDKDDPHCTAFLKAAVTSGALAIKVELDEGWYFDADCVIFMKENNQALADVQKVGFTAKPWANSPREPQFVTP